MQIDVHSNDEDFISFEICLVFNYLIIVLEKNNFQRIFIRLWFQPCQFDCFPHYHRHIEVNVRYEYNGVFNNNNVCYWLMHRDIIYVSVYIPFKIRFFFKFKDINSISLDLSVVKLLHKTYTLKKIQCIIDK